MTPTQAEYGLERLWALAAGSSVWEGPPAVDIHSIPRQSVLRLHESPPGAMAWVMLHELLPPEQRLALDTDRLPALCTITPDEPVLYAGRGAFPLDLVAATFLLLTRWEEKEVAFEPDEWGNYPARYSLASRQRFIDRPILDEWALVLRSWFENKRPGWQASPTAFRLAMSHDIDRPYKFTSWYRVLRSLGGTALRDRSVSKLALTMQRGLHSRINRSVDPFRLGLKALLDLDDEFGVQGTFFFMTADRGQFDQGYDLSAPPYWELVEEVQKRGHEVGWHPSYRAAEDDEVFWREKSRMDRLLDGIRYGARHHYLRWRVGHSWKRLAKAGCLYDASLGFNELMGFRCGTCRRFPVFDIARQEPLDLEERPLVIQDGTLFDFMRLLPTEQQERVRAIVSRVQAVDGELTILIHNSETEVDHQASSFFRNCLS